jgi:hypothetical protein
LLGSVKQQLIAQVETFLHTFGSVGKAA